MTIFGGLKDKLTLFYGRNSAAVEFLVRFLFVLAEGFFIRSALPFDAILSHPAVLLVLSLTSAVLPAKAGAVIGAVLLTGQAFALDLAAGAVTFLVLVMLYCLFMRFAPDDFPAAPLETMGAYYGFGALVPVLCGLRRKPLSLLTVCPGCVCAFLIRALSEHAEEVRALEQTDYMGKLKLLIGGAFSDELTAALAAVIAALTLTYLVRSLGIRHAHEAAVLSGSAIYLLFYVFGGRIAGGSPDVMLAAAGSAASAAAGLILLMVMLPLDYRKSERLEFEDDGYYYYVRAIPKAHGKHYVGESGAFSANTVPGYDEPIIRPDIDDDELKKKLEDSLNDL